MKAFEIWRGNESVACVLAEDESHSLEMFAQKCGFEDFDQLATTEGRPAQELKKELTVRALVDRMMARREKILARRGRS